MYTAIAFLLVQTSVISPYFDWAEYIFFRIALLIIFVLALVRLISEELRKR